MFTIRVNKWKRYNKTAATSEGTGLVHKTVSVFEHSMVFKSKLEDIQKNSLTLQPHLRTASFKADGLSHKGTVTISLRARL